MRRFLIAAGVLGVTALAGLVIFFRPGLNAADPKAGNDPPAARTANLPIAKAILYSSGVGYFQREGKVHDNSLVYLSCPVQDINDLLKSMVLRDLSGGHVSAVSYDSQAPVERTLKSFAVNLNNNPGFGQILQQVRGEKVEVVLQQSNATQPGTITGSIMGIEMVKQPAGKDAVVEAEQLNLWCAEGIRSVKLADIQRLRVLNPVMESEVRKALETLAFSHDTQKKAVSISFTGEGDRDVRVGYVIENPIWKTSYRLVLGKDGKPYLQGWAIVENPSDEDWTGVGMVLISGRPISFQMDLYQPLYVPRPVVVPELFASLRPPTYEGNLAMDPKPAVKVRPTGPQQDAAGGEGKGQFMEKQQAGQGQSFEIAGGFGGRGADYSDKLKKEIDGRMELAEGIRNAASAGQLGDFFQYVIDQPVNLARQK